MLAIMGHEKRHDYEENFADHIIPGEWCNGNKINNREQNLSYLTIENLLPQLFWGSCLVFPQ